MDEEVDDATGASGIVETSPLLLEHPTINAAATTANPPTRNITTHPKSDPQQTAHNACCVRSKFSLLDSSADPYPQTNLCECNSSVTSANNPYGPRPGGGISLPDYYRPPMSISNRNVYFPGTEVLPKNEMRVSFLGSTPFPPTRLQAGTSIIVELGHGGPQPRLLDCRRRRLVVSQVHMLTANF